MSTYPKIGATKKAKENTGAKCKCGNQAKHKVHIQLNIFRGDDEVVWSCDDHKKSVDFLLKEQPE